MNARYASDDGAVICRVISLSVNGMELIGVKNQNESSGNIIDPRCASSRANAVAFDRAELRTGLTLGHGLFLFVSGPRPQYGGSVRLLPRLNELFPEYRKIEVIVDSRAEEKTDAQAILSDRYETSMPLSEIVGTKGIIIIGANGTKKLSLTGDVSE